MVILEECSVADYDTSAFECLFMGPVFATKDHDARLVTAICSTAYGDSTYTGLYL